MCEAKVLAKLFSDVNVQFINTLLQLIGALGKAAEHRQSYDFGNDRVTRRPPRLTGSAIIRP